MISTTGLDNLDHQLDEQMMLLAQSPAADMSNANRRRLAVARTSLLKAKAAVSLAKARVAEVNSIHRPGQAMLPFAPPQLKAAE